jgi:hypothetical protein
MASYLRKTYEYTPFQYDKYTPSDEVNTAGKNKTNAQNAYDTWANAGYKQSQNVIDAGKKKTTAENALASYGDFSYSKSDTFNQIMDKILNREKFSYDVNGDALYQQYKDKYIQQGKMAMADTMGQAAAMTGGYGSSYSASVGNQAYQASLQQLNDVIPQLYQMAYDRYNQEGQDLYNQYGMLSDDRSTEYGMWGDKRNMLVADRDYYGNDYYNVSDRDYGQWKDKGSILGSNRDYWGSEYDRSFNRDYGTYSDDRNLAFGEHTNTENSKQQSVRDENAYNQWSVEKGIQEDQFERTMAFNEAQANKPTGNSGGGGTPSLSPGEYNDVMNNAGAYAEQGEGSLSNYLNGLVNRGYISGDEAADILDQFFPDIPGPKYDYSMFGRGGLFQDMIN